MAFADLRQSVFDLRDAMEGSAWQLLANLPVADRAKLASEVDPP